LAVSFPRSAGGAIRSPATLLHEMRCCSDVAISQWTEKCSGGGGKSQFGSDNACYENKNYAEAHVLCF